MSDALDDDLLFPDLGELRRHEAREGVGAVAGREGDDDADLAKSVAGQKKGKDKSEKLHGTTMWVRRVAMPSMLH